MIDEVTRYICNKCDKKEVSPFLPEKWIELKHNNGNHDEEKHLCPLCATGEEISRQWHNIIAGRD